MPRPLPNPRDFVSNWRTSDATIAEKLRMLRKNTAIKVKNRSDCCGNYGEVGC
ncbi:MAG: hypothetical protein OEX04_19705 [Acidimicrobiia bacterium]|nr:hypothetical protein [Acidimicrobiia bacterium]MDH4309703.1 hypothetical protein [Acidimicrobiia bacterium]MDH5293141.1 hypothetical protein [Acidimicrobiia bacterium]